MAKAGRVTTIVLSEDGLSLQFTTIVLKELDLGLFRPRPNPTTGGRGSAKQWIDSAYANEVKGVISRSKFQRVRLIVVSDVDEFDTKQRLANLEAELPADIVQAARDVTIHWLPRWHIETWVLFLTGHDVTESENLKTQFKSLAPDVRLVAKRFAEHVQSPSRDHELTKLPSLLAAVIETRRLLALIPTK